MISIGMPVARSGSKYEIPTYAPNSRINSGNIRGRFPEMRNAGINASEEFLEAQTEPLEVRASSEQFG